MKKQYCMILIVLSLTFRTQALIFSEIPVMVGLAILLPTSVGSLYGSVSEYWEYKKMLHRLHKIKHPYINTIIANYTIDSRDLISRAIGGSIGLLASSYLARELYNNRQRGSASPEVNEVESEKVS